MQKHALKTKYHADSILLLLEFSYDRLDKLLLALDELPRQCRHVVNMGVGGVSLESPKAWYDK